MKKIFLTLIVLIGTTIPWACSKNNNPISPAPTATLTPIPTNWAGYTNTSTPTSTATATATATNINGYTSTVTPTPTITSTLTITPTSTQTGTPTNTATYTASPTSTNTFIPTSTFSTSPPTLTGTPWTTGSYSPSGLAANSSGTTVYVAEEGEAPAFGQVEEFNSSGVSVGTLAGVTFAVPYGTAVDGSGNIYVVDRGNNGVYVFNSSGGYQTTLTSWTTTATGPTSFSSPEGIAVDSANLYVADTGNDEIEIFALGSFSSSVTEWGGTGSGAGTFNNPSAVALDGSGNLYVADASNQLIQIFNPTTFTYSSEFSTVPGSDIYGIAINGTNLYAADVANSQVEIYNLVGSLLAAGPGNNAPNNPSPDGVIIFGSDILVSDFNNNGIYNFQP